jgi:hypothetical protein
MGIWARAVCLRPAGLAAEKRARQQPYLVCLGQFRYKSPPISACHLEDHYAGPPFRDHNVLVHSICAIADHRAYDELLIMLKSLSLFAELDIYVGGDREVVERLGGERIDNPVHCHQVIPDGMVVKQGTPEFLKLVARKMDIMEIALDRSANTMLIDTDMIFFHSLWGVDLDRYEVALSRHMILPADEAEYGHFNAGYLGSSQRRFPQWWRDKLATSRYYEQECLNEAPREFKTQELSIHHNFGWWRLNQCDERRKWWRIDLPTSPVRRERLSRFRVQADRILFNDDPLVSIHTHITDRRKSRFQSANRLALDLLGRSSNPKHKEILSWL